LKTLLIVYHTMTGGSARMADAARKGAAAEPQVNVRLLRAAEAAGEDVLAADGYVFVTPENLASMAGVMKDFFDRTYYAALDRIQARPYATLVCAGSDGTNAVRQIERICTGWQLKAVCEPIIVCTHAQTPEAILAPKTIPADEMKRCEETGAAIAAGNAMGIY
jgi:multimeric flavodoxin WrbA